MNPRKNVGIACAVVGAVFVLVGLVIGFLHVDRDTVTCGSAFGGLSHAAEVADIDNTYSTTINGYEDHPTAGGSVVGDCKAALSDRKTVAWSIVVPGGLALIAAVVIALAKPRETPVKAADQPAASTVSASPAVAEIERLVELHRQGALTDDEFTAAKAKLLN